MNGSPDAAVLDVGAPIDPHAHVHQYPADADGSTLLVVTDAGETLAEIRLAADVELWAARGYVLAAVRALLPAVRAQRAARVARASIAGYARRLRLLS